MLAHQYVIEIYRQAEPTQLIHRAPLGREVWAPAVEASRLDALRRDRRQPLVIPSGPEKIEPLWHRRLGQPYVEGFRVTLDSQGVLMCSDFQSDYFADAARSASAQLIEQGQIQVGDNFGYFVCAYPLAGDEDEEDRGAEANRVRLAVKEVTHALAVRETPIEEFLAAAACGEIHDDDPPVFIPSQVLEEATQQHQEAGAAETGGTLLGYRHRDPNRPGLFFIEVTAQIPARHANGELMSLEFTPQDWADADAALRLRGGEEIKAGWWHSHPAKRWCEKCPIENRKVCKLNGEFFSSHDVALHKAIFPNPLTVALVVSDSYAHGLTYPLFGWRKGRIVQRGFYKLQG
jgi:proteasome lid subunit RPN8/RPN11